MRITLQQIRVFLSVAQQEHVGQAAEALFMSQSAVSTALSDLESQLNQRLFDRIGKKIILNSNGKRLLPAAQAIADQVLALPHLISDKNLEGELTIGASSTIGSYILPALIMKYQRLYPNVKIKLETYNSYAIAKGIRDMVYDVGFVESDSVYPGVESILWKKDSLVIVAAADHPLCKRKSVTMEQLKHAHWIVRELGSGTRMMFDRYFQPHFQPQIQAELNNTESIKSAVLVSDNLSCISVHAVKNEIKQRQLKVLSIPGLTIERQLHRVSHPDRYQSPLVNHFLKIVQA